MGLQKNFILHSINIYHLETLTNPVEGLQECVDHQSDRAMYTEQPIKSSLDRLIDDGMLTHGFMPLPVIPGLVIHLQWLKRTEFEY